MTPAQVAVLTDVHAEVHGGRARRKPEAGGVSDLLLLASTPIRS